MFSLDHRAVASAFGYSQLATWEWNPSTDELRWTSGQSEVYAYPVAELNSTVAWSAIVHPDDRDRVVMAAQRSVQVSQGFREHFRIYTRDGKIVWILGYGQIVRLPDHSVRMLGMNMEVTDWVDALAESEARFSATFEQAAVGIAHLDIDGRELDVNRRCCEILGYSKEELLNLTFAELTYPADLNTDSGLVQELLRGERSNYSIEKRFYTKSKQLVWVNLTVSLVRKSDGSPDYFISVIEDITSRVRIKAQRDEMIDVLEERVRERTAELEKLSMTDPLTEVANRRRLDEQIEIEWDRAVRAKDPLSIVIIDIDHFKELNDCLGHGPGDRALVAFAGELKQIARRPADLIARFGGDEFVLVLPETDPEGAMCIAKQVQMAVQWLDFPNPGSPISSRVTVSQGIATAWPAKKGDGNSLMLEADQELYKAKEAGRNRISAAAAESQVKSEQPGELPFKP
jgi:diguanylate cyclase (GGDEF)-like protein/PAS domain S-box-containing protein